MASAKSLKMIDVSQPTAPTEAKEALNADPGQVDQPKARQTQRDPGRPETIGVVPMQRADGQPPEPPPRHWIGVVLTDDTGAPVPNERFRLKMSDGTIVEGTLDEHGYRRVEGVEPGGAQVCFPDTDAKDWRPA